MSTEASMSSLQKQMQIGMPIVMTLVTTWQPAAVQVYFLISASLGGITAYCLKQPGFRRLVRIRPLPTPESHKLYSKVVKGEVELSAIRGADGKIRYQAPNAARTTTSSSGSGPASTARGINLKAGTALPPHMRKAAPKVDKEYQDRDVDYEEGMPKEGGVGKKWDWIKRNYRPGFIAKRLSGIMDSRDPSVKAAQDKKEKAKQRARAYELERKRRLENRR